MFSFQKPFHVTNSAIPELGIGTVIGGGIVQNVNEQGQLISGCQMAIIWENHGEAPCPAFHGPEEVKFHSWIDDRLLGVVDSIEHLVAVKDNDDIETFDDIITSLGEKYGLDVTLDSNEEEASEETPELQSTVVDEILEAVEEEGESEEEEGEERE